MVVVCYLASCYKSTMYLTINERKYQKVCLTYCTKGQGTINRTESADKPKQFIIINGASFLVAVGLVGSIDLDAIRARGWSVAQYEYYLASSQLAVILSFLNSSRFAQR